MYSPVRNTWQLIYILCEEDNKSWIILYVLTVKIWFSRQVSYINPSIVCYEEGTRRVDPQTFVHCLEDSSSRVRCLLDDEERGEVSAESRSLFTLRLSTRRYNVIRRVHVSRTGGRYHSLGIVSDFKLHSAKRKSPGLQTPFKEREYKLQPREYFSCTKIPGLPVQM